MVWRPHSRGFWWDFTFEACTKNPLPVIGRGSLQPERFLVVRVFAGGCRVVEFTRRANRFLPRIGPRKPSRHVPVEMVDGLRVFGVGLGQFAGEKLRLLLEPSRPQGLDSGAGRWVGCPCCNALI